MTDAGDWDARQRAFQAGVVLDGEGIDAEVWAVRRWAGSVGLRRSRLRRRAQTRPAWLVALYASPPMLNGRPRCVVEVSDDDATQLPVEGAAVVVGRVGSGENLGLFVDDHIVWPVAPPRPPVPGDPGWGEGA